MNKDATQVSPLMRELATYMSRALRRPLPKDVVEKIKHHVLDTVAAMVSGSRLLPGRKAISYVKTLGGVRVIVRDVIDNRQQIGPRGLPPFKHRHGVSCRSPLVPRP